MFDISEFINQLSEDTLLEIVEHDPYIIQHITHPSVAIQKAAVRIDPKVIVFIDKPQEEVQIISITQDKSSINYIMYPTPAVKKLYSNHYATDISFSTL